MPNRPQDPQRFQTWANDINTRLRLLERRLLRGEEHTPLAVYEDGTLLGEILHMDFASGITAVLTERGRVQVTSIAVGGAYTWQSPKVTPLPTGVFSRFYLEKDGTISFVRAERESGDGTGTATLDLLLNGVSIYPTATKPTVTAGAFLGAETTPDTTAFAKGDYFEVEIEATGGGTGPLRLTIALAG